LLGRLSGGDRSALSQAFRILHPVIQRFCEKQLGRGPDADDATQQSLEQVFERVETYDATRSALPWVFAIASWEVKTIRRRVGRHDQRTSSESVDELLGAQQDPEFAAMSSQFLAAVCELIDALPSVDRETVRETLARELDAEATAPTNVTFRKRKERALQKIRALLRNLGHAQ
jgi:RNA polymerase sigma factor (sigma-70 family)